MDVDFCDYFEGELKTYIRMNFWRLFRPFLRSGFLKGRRLRPDLFHEVLREVLRGRFLFFFNIFRGHFEVFGSNIRKFER